MAGDARSTTRPVPASTPAEASAGVSPDACLPHAMASYLAAIENLIDGIRHEARAVQRAADLVAASFIRGGQVYVFGTGHSNLIALDAFYRAGGLAPICPILEPSLMLHEGAVESTRRERLHGIAAGVLARYDVNPECDCLVVVSNSGMNTVPIEMAMAGKAIGIPVISISSFAYAAALDGAPGLAEIADVAIDNHCPPGDSIVAINDQLPRMAPGSTIAGSAVLHSILLCAAESLVKQGRDPQVFVSANMPGGSSHNAALVERWRPRNPHL